MSIRLSSVIFVILMVERSQATTRPNIVFILADDLGWNDVGFHGSDIRTPTLDHLAYQGIILNNYYVSPICTPTRGALMTGKHPIRLGLQRNVIFAAQPYGLPLSHTTMAEHLKRLGYATHMVGKWHLGFFRKEYTPTSRGFDSHYGFWTGGQDYYTHQNIVIFKGYDFRRNENVLWNASSHYSTELFTAEAERIIKQHDKSKPLFLYVAHQAVHAGNNKLQAPQKYIDRCAYIQNQRRRKYAGMVTALDDSVASITRALTEKGMFNNTVIVFSTDNGGPSHRYNNNVACNYPLRGTKNTLWEGGVRGVGFIHSKIFQSKPYISQHLMHVTDWLPTLYRAARGNVSNLGAIDGIDLWDMFKNNGATVRTELLHNIDPYKSAAIRVGGYKLIRGNISGRKDDLWYRCTPADDRIRQMTGKPGTASNRLRKLNVVFDIKEETFNNMTGLSLKPRVLNKRLRKSDGVFKVRNERVNAGIYRHFARKVIVNCGPKPANVFKNCKPAEDPCLFHIPSDPCEYNNLASARPEVVRKLSERLKKYAESAVPPGNKRSDPKANPKLHGGVWISWQTET